MMTLEEMLSHIDAKAGTARSCYITVAPGQEATYLLKAQHARLYQNAGYSGEVPSLVNAESEADEQSPELASQRIIAEETVWISVAAEIERVRRTGKVQAATLEGDARELAYRSAIVSLTALMV